MSFAATRSWSVDHEVALGSLRSGRDSETRDSRIRLLTWGRLRRSELKRRGRLRFVSSVSHFTLTNQNQNDAFERDTYETSKNHASRHIKSRGFSSGGCRGHVSR